LTQVVVPVPVTDPTVTDPCAAFDNQPEPDNGASRLTVRDLAQLADLGRPMADQGPSAFAIAPDGRQIAVMVNRANPDANAYCQKILVVPLSGGQPAEEIGRGGEFDFADFPLRNFAVVYAGWQKARPPQWSPDGASVAYLRRENGVTQVWIADPDGRSSPRQATRQPAGIDTFAWTRDGSAIVVTSRPGVAEAMRAIADEGREGYLFDERFSPQFADHPIPGGPISSEFHTVSVADGTARPTTAPEKELLAPPRPTSLPDTAILFARGPSGQLAWLEPAKPGYLVSPTQWVRKDESGEHSICDSAVCDGIEDFWWSHDDQALIALQRTGWAKNETAVLRWKAGAAAPVRVLVTPDLLTGCQLSGTELLCGRESSTRPRRLVALDSRSGAERVLYDPNPQFARQKLGRVERLFIRNAYGVESFADLVLPPDHLPGQRHPLVVVQYESRGFLRGGTGNEVPVQPLAARGFAVLSFHRPGLLPAARAARNVIETRTLVADPWADRAQILSSLEQAIGMAVQRGVVDSDRIGIHGFSDGGASVQYALINSDVFKVAALGTCCEDMGSYALAAGPGFTRFLREMGYPYFEPGGEKFWRTISLLLNVEQVSVPILIQASDSEYEGALDVVETYRHRGRPIELFVFPGETHFKWQPAHRLAIYRRNLEWFEFWLAGRIDCAPEKAVQYERWLAMVGAPQRAELTCGASGSAADRANPVLGFEQIENAFDQHDITEFIEPQGLLEGGTIEQTMLRKTPVEQAFGDDEAILREHKADEAVGTRL
jgi:dipeptidyl aminopeptidase/acylaminoacyl peptidase